MTRGSSLSFDWATLPLPRSTAQACAVRTDPTGASGDWADVVQLGGGRVAVVVGDAMGRGQAAAPLAAQLARAARLLLAAGATPRQVLGGLDAIVTGFDDVIATVVCAVVELDSGRLAVASAGHPPPLVIPQALGAVSNGGGAEGPGTGGGGRGEGRDSGLSFLLPCRPLPPLGYGLAGAADPGPSRWTVAPSVLFFYTDGLADELPALPAGVVETDDLGMLCEQIIEAAVPDPPGDDVTVLALRVG